jgi:hypothetical protein
MSGATSILAAALVVLAAYPALAVCVAPCEISRTEASDPVKGATTFPQVEAQQGQTCRVTLDASSRRAIWVDAYFEKGLDVGFLADKDRVLRVGEVIRVPHPRV